MTYIPENRFHAPLAEKMDDELLLAVRKDHADAAACHAQLVANGWTSEQVAQAVAR